VKDPTALAAAEQAPDRGALAQLVTQQLGARGPAEQRALAARLQEVLARVDDAALARFARRLRETGGGWGYHEPDPVARALGRVVQDAVLEPGSELIGVEHLRAADARPRIFLANHLSFADANLLEHLLARAGGEDLVARLTVVVGPKVYTRPLRRLASLCFGTIKIPQSASRASGEAVMSQRDVARLSAEMLGVAEQRLALGDALLVFVEGTRSRTGRMQRALSGVARYLEIADAALFPVGIAGSERLVPIEEEERLHPTRVRVQVGAPIDAADLRARCGRRRPLAMDAIGLRIAALLPPEYRGVYDGSDAALAEARAIADAL
jgi:1-acyl-sn-glycerol-3-phosphate acyltransferase